MKILIKYIVLLIFTFSFTKIKSQVGTLTGTGMSICNLYSFNPNYAIGF